MAEAGKGRRPVVFLGVPMAINVRDVLRTDVLPLVREAGVDVHLFTAAATESSFIEEFGGEGVTLHALRWPRGRVFRWIDAAVLKLYVLVLSLRCETAHIMVQGTLRRNPLARLARALLHWTGRRGQAAVVRRGRDLVLQRAPDLYGDLFEAHRPDLVIGTRVLTMSAQTGPEASAYLDRYLVMSAARRGVPSMVLVSSWDNLTSKGFFPADVARLTVWNSIMHDEAVQLHDIAPERITVTGAPQHDVYAGAPYRARERFFRELGLDPAKRLVLYTTQTAGTIPAEPELVERIHERLQGTFPDLQLLVRLHQLDRPERYAFLHGRPGLVFDAAGRAALGTYRDRDFDHSELRRLADSLVHADVVLNAASSISIDAAAVGTPVVAIAFDADEGVPYDRSVRRYFDFTHQQNVVRSGGVAMADSLEAMVEAVAAYLDDPSRDREGRARLVERLCYRLDGGSGRRVAEAILAELGLSLVERSPELAGRSA
ncbi:MAG: CDP-glycerol glycerophosphotransferase family protein [Gemmatimonadota bacterium]